MSTSPTAPLRVTIWGTALGGGDLEHVCSTRYSGHTLPFRGTQKDPQQCIVWMPQSEHHVQPEGSFALAVQGIYSRMGLVTSGLFAGAHLLVAPTELTEDGFRTIADELDHVFAAISDSAWAPASIQTEEQHLPGAAFQGLTAMQIDDVASRVEWRTRAFVSGEHVSSGPAEIRWTADGDVATSVTIPAHAYILQSPLPDWLRQRAARLPERDAEGGRNDPEAPPAASNAC